MTFTEDVYAVIRDGCLRSARTVVPIVMELLHPESVIDFGCGEGLWLSVFAEHGCRIRGVDSGQGHLAIPTDAFVAADLASTAVFEGHHDLAVCLEVAEHLPAERADWLVDTLVDHADTVLFSAAIPGQGGHGHINEQWPRYWAEKFEARGMAVTARLRWELWDRAPGEVENWYAQNLLLCVRDQAPIESWFEGPAAQPFPVVHPVLWDSRR